LFVTEKSGRKFIAWRKNPKQIFFVGNTWWYADGVRLKIWWSPIMEWLMKIILMRSWRCIVLQCGYHGIAGESPWPGWFHQ
jgi:hypothetical protein